MSYTLDAQVIPTSALPASALNVIVIDAQGSGPPGAQGIPGPVGPGVPVGGAVGDLLTKSSTSDYAAAWAAPTFLPLTGGTASGLLVLTRTSAAADALNVRVNTDAQPRFRVLAGGTLAWGDGTAATDATLQRITPGLMRMTGQWWVGPNAMAGLQQNGTGPDLAVSGANRDGFTLGNVCIWGGTAGAFAADTGGSMVLGGYFDPTQTTPFARIGGAKTNGTSGDFGGYLWLGTRPSVGSMTERLRITSTGDVNVTGGNLTLAGSGALTMSGLALVSPTVTSLPTSVSGLRSNTTGSLAFDEAVFGIFGTRSTAIKSGAGNLTSGFSVRAVMAEAVNNGTGQAKDLVSVATVVQNLNTGVVSTGTGVYVFPPTCSAANPINTAYGLLIDVQKQTGVTTGYGIYQSGANDLNIFAGPIICGGANPATTGTIRMPNGGAIWGRNAANNTDVRLITVDSANTVYVGSPVGQTAIQGGYLVVPGTLIIGTTPATLGAIRLPNNSSIYARSADNTANMLVIDFNTSNNITIGGTGSVVVLNGTSALVNGDLSMFDAKNIVMSGTTGTKIGTTATQKLALWNKTPDVQPTTAITGAAFVVGTGTAVNDASTFDGYTLKQITAALRRLGALA